MDTQQAIAKVLQDFTAELLKVFSAAVVDAVSQVNSASRAISGGEAPVAAPRRGRPRKDATAAAPPKARKAPAKESRVLKSTPEQVSRLGCPVIAIGGVTAERCRELRDAGAHGVAAITALWDAPHPYQAARALLAPWADDPA